MLLVLVLIILVGLAVSLRSYLMAYLVQPLALLFWAAWRILTSVHQNIYWVFLIGLCSLLIVRLALSGKGYAPASAYNEYEQPLNLVDAWRTLIDETAPGSKEHANLQESLKKLLCSVLMEDERAASPELAALIASRQPQLSLEAQRFLFPAELKRRAILLRQLQRAIAFAPGWLRPWLRIVIRPDYALIDEILTYIETELELRHGS